MCEGVVVCEFLKFTVVYIYIDPLVVGIWLFYLFFFMQDRFLESKVSALA